MVEVDGDPYQRFAAILEQITFRDWRWRLGTDDARCYVQIEFDAPDSTHALCGGTGRVPHNPLLCMCVGPQRGRKWFLSPHMTKGEVVQTCLVAVLAAVEHEAREDFQYRGAAIFGPHYDVDALYLLASDGRLDVRS